MHLQDLAWAILLIGAGIITLGFIVVVVMASKPSDAAQTAKFGRTTHVVQVWWFLILALGFVVGSFITLQRYPIPPQHTDLGAAQVVNVVGRQWSWQIKPDTVHTGSRVEFRVTSDDVNHDFAVYDPDGRVVVQTQAMPGYTNKLLHTFEHPGTYTVRCLEYCGLMHAQMTREIRVVAADAATARSVVATSAPAAPVSGEKVYADHCAVCHQATGRGLPGVFPPLAGDPVVTAADPTEHIRIVLHGTHGRTIHGATYVAQMPGWASELSDEEVAAVINHERTSWGNHAPAVTQKDVAAER